MAFIRKTKINGKTYLYLVTNTWIKGKVKQKYLAYLGREEKLPILLQTCLPMQKILNAKIENLSYQAPVSFWNVMEQVQLREILAKHASKNWGVDSATAACVMVLNYATERTSKNKLEGWYAQTYLPYLLNVPADKMNKDLLCRTMDFFTDDKIEMIHSEVFRTARELYKLSEELVFYDLTSVTFEGSECPMAKKGYNPEALDRPQVNLALAVTSEKFPAAHKVFEGNTKDVKTLETAIALLKKTVRLGNVVFVFDRGIKSEANLQRLEAEGAGYICGISKSPNTRKLILSIPDSSFTRIDEVTLAHETSQDERRVIVYWNAEIAKSQMEERYKRIEKIEKKLSVLAKNASRYPKSRLYEKIGMITRKYRRYFVINAKDGLVFSRKESALKTAEMLDGKHAIATNTSLSAVEVLGHYRGRNVVEMSFRDLKMFVSIGPIRHWKEQRVKVHLFLAVLAFGLRSIVELKAKRAGIQLSVEEIISRLNKVRALVAKGKVLRLTGEDEETAQIVAAVEK